MKIKVLDQVAEIIDYVVFGPDVRFKAMNCFVTMSVLLELERILGVPVNNIEPYVDDSGESYLNVNMFRLPSTDLWKEYVIDEY